MSNGRLDGAALRGWAHTCVGDLIVHTDEINRLNVFPVADADTGTNMLFTMRSAVARIDSLDESASLREVAAALATGALYGARGNSGVILSQILRAMAEGIGDGTEITAAQFAEGLRMAVGLVVEAMGGETVEGTIVSVLQAASAAAENAAATGDCAVASSAAADAAAAALDVTPQQLAVLAEAGVVDSGGRGLLVLLDALAKTLGANPAKRGPYEPARPECVPAPELVAPPAFEVMYHLTGCGPEDVDGLRERLEELGDSVVIAGLTGSSDGTAPCAGSGTPATSGTTSLGSAGLDVGGPRAGGTTPPFEPTADGYSVHVHADDAGAAVEAGLAMGTPSRIQISSLRGGTSGPAPASWSRDRAVLAVVDGDGAERLFADEGAFVLRPAPPGHHPAVSAQQLLRAIVDTGASTVLVLPNGYVAAEELVAGCTAAIGWGIDVVPLPTRSMVQGLAALAVHDSARAAVNDGYTMAAAAGSTRYGSVRAAEEEALTWAGPCRSGDGLGIFGGEVLVVRHDVVAAGRGLIDLMLGVGGELVTVLLGAAADEQVGILLGEHVRRHHLGTELVSYATGHDGDAVIIGVE